MKIFLGTLNIASQLNDWKVGFEKNGCFVRTATHRSHSITAEGDFDYSFAEPDYKLGFTNSHTLNKYYKQLNQKIRTPKKEIIFKKILKECDVFFYVWTGVFDDFRDFEMIKDAGKKIIVQFVGDDVRWEPSMRQEFQKLNFPLIEYDKYDFSTIGLNSKLNYLRHAEKYADLIYSAPSQAGLALKPYAVNFQQINTNEFSENIHQRKYKPKVLHMPSNAAVKGTKYVREVFDKLQKKGIDFEPIIPDTILSYTDAKKLYQDCDILVGQLLIPGGGKQERELLACGKVVLSNIAPSYESYIPNDSPIIDVDQYALEEELEKIVLDYKSREHLAQKGRSFIEKYHNPKKVTAKILTELESGYQGQVFQPIFFREEFIPESLEHTAVYNEWTNFVAQSSWYKQTIPQGERAGLIF